MTRLAAAANLGIAYAGLISHGFQYAQRSIRWQGLPTLLLGFLLISLIAVAQNSANHFSHRTFLPKSSTIIQN